MTATVPAPEETSGDFSQSGSDIFDPASTRPNPAFDPSRPVSGSNPQSIRDPFPGNQIPFPRISPVAYNFLQNYVPMPNMMNMNSSDMGMIMNMGMNAGGGMGTPSVFGAGTDSNNYLDVRRDWHTDNQATGRIDRVFDNGDSLFARYSFSSEKGFMPQNLPGVGANHDNLAQNANVTFNKVLRPNLLNIASIAVSRLTMHRYSETTPATTTSSASSEFRASVSAARALTALLTSTCRAIRALATLTSLPPCTPTTPSSRGATR